MELGVLLGGTRETSQTLMEEIVDFETTLANITIPLEERRDEELIYHKMEAKDLAVSVSWYSALDRKHHCGKCHVSDPGKATAREDPVCVCVCFVFFCWKPWNSFTKERKSPCACAVEAHSGLLLTLKPDKMLLNPRHLNVLRTRTRTEMLMSCLTAWWALESKRAASAPKKMLAPV